MDKLLKEQKGRQTECATFYNVQTRNHMTVFVVRLPLCLLFYSLPQEKLLVTSLSSLAYLLDITLTELTRVAAGRDLDATMNVTDWARVAAC